MAELPPSQLKIERLGEVELTELHWSVFQLIDWDILKSHEGYQVNLHRYIDLLQIEMAIRGAAE